MRPTTCELATDQLTSIRRLALLGHYPLAIQLCRQIVRLHPDLFAARLTLARLLLDQPDAPAALAQLDAIEAYAASEHHNITDAQLRRARLLRGRCLVQLDRPSDAIAVWRLTHQRWPRCVPALRSLALLHLQQLQPDLAMQWVQRIIDVQGPTRSTHRLLADIHQQAGRPADALRSLAAAHRGTLPPSLRAARLLAQAQLDAQACEVYAALHAADPHDPQLLVEYTTVLQRLGDDRQIQQVTSAMLKLDSTHETLSLTLASCLMRLNQFPQAGRLLWRLARRAAHCPQAWASLAVCAACESRNRLFDRAIAELSSRQHDPAQRQALLIEGWQQAIPSLVMQQATSPARNPEHNLLHALLSQSQAIFEDQLAQFPDHADTHYHLSVCHATLDQPAAAADCLDHALQINPGYILAAQSRLTLLLREENYQSAIAVATALEHARGPIPAVHAMHAAVHVARGDHLAALAVLDQPALTGAGRQLAAELSLKLLNDADLHDPADAWSARLTPMLRATEAQAHIAA